MLVRPERVNPVLDISCNLRPSDQPLHTLGRPDLMAADVEIKRLALRGLYGDRWKARVDKMSEAQVIALYLKFKKEGKIK